MEANDYFRLWVKLHCAHDVADWTHEDIMATFLLLPSPSRTLEQWAGVISAASTPPELTEEQKMQANLDAYNAMKPKPKKTPTESPAA